MELAVCSAAISLSSLVACPFAFAGSQHGVSIKVFTSADLLLAIERGATANVKP